MAPAFTDFNPEDAMWEYTDKTKEHFLNPRNVGFIDDFDGIGEVGSLACGDALKLTFKLGEDGRTRLSVSRDNRVVGALE